MGVAPEVEQRRRNQLGDRCSACRCELEAPQARVEDVLKYVETSTEDVRTECEAREGISWMKQAPLGK